MNLIWFVEEACKLAGIPPHTWVDLQRSKQVKIIEDWQKHVGTPLDFVKLANLKPGETVMSDVIISEKPQNLPYDDFAKLDIRVGTVIAAEAVPKSKKLLKLNVYFGEAIGYRTILAGIALSYPPESMVDKQVVAVLNLAPRPMMGITSHGMLLAGHNVSGGLSLVECPLTSPGEEIG